MLPHLDPSFKSRGPRNESCCTHKQKSQLDVPHALQMLLVRLCGKMNAPIVQGDLATQLTVSFVLVLKYLLCLLVFLTKFSSIAMYCIGMHDQDMRTSPNHAIISAGFDLLWTSKLKCSTEAACQFYSMFTLDKYVICRILFIVEGNKWQCFKSTRKYHLPSWELTCPIPRHLCKWFSYSQGGMC